MDFVKDPAKTNEAVNLLQTEFTKMFI